MLVNQYYKDFVLDRVKNTHPMNLYISSANMLTNSQSLSDNFVESCDTDFELIENTLGLSAWFNKYDFHSSYPYHRAAPSVRSLKTIDIYVLELLNNKKCISKYNPYFNRLEFVHNLTEYEVKKLLKYFSLGNIYFVLATGFDQLVDKYGEFSYQLCLLDCGHLLGQLSIVLQRLGFVGEIKLIDNAFKLLSDMQIIDKNYKVLSILSVKANKLNIDLRLTNKVLTNNIELEKNIFLEFKDTLKLCEQFSDRNYIFKVPNLKECSRLLKCNVQDFNKIIMNRTSAHNSLGQSGVVTKNDLKKIDEIFYNFTIKNFDKRINLFVLKNNGNCYILYKYDIKTEKLVSIQKRIEYKDIENISIQKKSSLTLDTYEAIIFFSVNLLEVNSSMISIDEIYLKCGILAQFLCLSAADLGLFCRPIKGTNEKFINPIIGENLFYTLLLGKSNFDFIYQHI